LIRRLGAGGAALLPLACSLGCAEGEDAGTSRALPYSFTDVTESAGLAGFHQINGDPEKPFILDSIGAGVALFDCDGDGDLDAYLTNGSRLGAAAPSDAALESAVRAPRDALYANDGGGAFADRTDAAGLGWAGWTQGVRVADVEGDGDPDLYLTCYGPNVLYQNLGDGTFRDVTEAAGVGDPRWSGGACLLDHDRDGDLDLYVANYLDFDEERMLADRPVEIYHGISVYKGPRGLPAARDRFYANDGAGVFEDVSTRTGVDAPEAFGFQCATFDVDGDGWMDVFVANDSVANLLWRNDREGGFEDVALTSGVALNMFGKAQSSMGVAVGDGDGDLRVDLYVTHFSHDYSTFYRGVEGGFFVDATHRLRLVADTEPDIAWGCGFVDFDSDGDLEIFAVNGHVYPQVDLVDVGLRYAERNDLFELDGDAYRVPPGRGGPGFDVERVSRGAAEGDVDGDGDVDLLIGNLDAPPTMLRNDGPSGNWVKVRLIGPGANRDAVGARLVARVGERRQLRLVGTGGSFLSSPDPRQHFGLGTAGAIDELTVAWPDGKEEVFTELAAGALVTIERQADGPSRVRRTPLGER